MSLRFAILVMLDNRPTTGYEIAQEMAEDNGYIWQATHQQVYLEIKKLHQLEWISLLGQTNEKSKTYEITAEGLRQLQHWLDQPQALPRVRDPLMVKLAAGYLTSHDQLKSEILEQQHFYRSRLATLNKFSRYYSRYDQDFKDRFRLKYRALQLSIDQLQLWLDWSNQLLKDLDY